MPEKKTWQGVLREGPKAGGPDPFDPPPLRLRFLDLGPVSPDPRVLLTPRPGDLLRDIEEFLEDVRQHPPAITSKAAMYQALRSGRLGNTVPHYFGLEEWLVRPPEDDAPTWGIRSMYPGGACNYHVPTLAVPALVRQRGDPCNISPMQPDDKIVAQGEAVLCPDLRLHYSTSPAPMRTALKEYGRHASGLRAWALLRSWTDPASVEMLEGLLDRYLGHAVEFSCYRCLVGRLRMRTLVWEVRLY
jgi:hypothetical protein